METDRVPSVSGQRHNSGAISSLHFKDGDENVENSTVEQCMHIEVPENVEQSSNTSQLVTQECRCCTPPPWKRQRMALTSGVQQIYLTAKKAQLYATAGYFRKQQIAVQKRLSTTKARLRDATRYFYLASTRELLMKLTPKQRIFIETQLRSVKNKSKGRRYSLDEKILSLSLYKEARRHYKLLSYMFNLPCQKVLKAMLTKLIMEPGINLLLFKQLAKRAERMQPSNRVCYLMWAEVAVQPHIDYCPFLDHMIGLEDHGHGMAPKFADKALVFMLRGIQTGWKLPLAFYFSDGRMKFDILIGLINEIASELAQTKLKLVAFVCDQGLSNVKAINTMVATDGRSDGTIPFHGFNIIPLFDPPHLMKGIRNNLLNKDLEIDVQGSKGDRNYASWKIVQLAYEMNQTDSTNRILRKITDEHICPEHLKKMHVKNAVEVFSRTMAAFMNYVTYIDGFVNTINGPLAMPVKEGRATAQVLLFFNNVFDSVNGETRNRDVPLRSIVTEKSPHHVFWPSAIKKLQDMQFVKIDDKTPVNGELCLKNWIRTLKGFVMLTETLKKNGIRSFKPRYINQEPLENFFRYIRELGCRYTKPTCLEFVGNFKTLLLNDLTIRKTRRNCETACAGSLLFTLRRCMTSLDEADLHSSNP